MNNHYRPNSFQSVMWIQSALRQSVGQRDWYNLDYRLFDMDKMRHVNETPKYFIRKCAQTMCTYVIQLDLFHPSVARCRTYYPMVGAKLLCEIPIVNNYDFAQQTPMLRTNIPRKIWLIADFATIPGHIQSPVGNFATTSSRPYLNENDPSVRTRALRIGLMILSGVPVRLHPFHMSFVHLPNRRSTIRDFKYSRWILPIIRRYLLLAQVNCSAF